MVLDYSERRQATKTNKPRRQPVGFYSILALVLFGGVFALGMFTGWYLYHPGGRLAKMPTQPSQATQSQPSAPVTPVAPQKSSAPGNPRADVPLTFYETLPKGSKGLIGTGLNPKREESAGRQSRGEAKLMVPPAPAPEPSTVTTQPAAAKANEPAKSQSPAKSSETVKPPAASKVDTVKSPEAAKQVVPNKQQEQVKPQAAARPAEQPARFCVQIASHRDRKEADDERGKLQAKGVAAYVVESKVEGKGTWYRIRVGKHLSQKDAEGLAGRLGKGVLVIPD